MCCFVPERNSKQWIQTAEAILKLPKTDQLQVLEKLRQEDSHVLYTNIENVILVNNLPNDLKEEAKFMAICAKYKETK